MNPSTELWDAGASAGLYSQFAGVLAGVAFVGLTLVITQQVVSDDRNPDRAGRHTVGEFFMAFLVLAVAALEWAIVAGDNTSGLRPSASAVFASVTLCIGAVQMTAGICYLVVGYDLRTRDSLTTELSVARTCRTGYVFIVALAIYQITLSACDLIVRGYDGREFPGPSMAWYLVPIGATGLAVVAMTLGTSKGIEYLAGKRPQFTANYSHRRVLGALTIASVVAFSVVMNVEPSDSLVTYGAWGIDFGVVVYMLALVGTVMLSAALFVIQAWIIEDHLRRARVSDLVPPDLLDQST